MKYEKKGMNASSSSSFEVVRRRGKHDRELYKGAPIIKTTRVIVRFAKEAVESANGSRSTARRKKDATKQQQQRAKNDSSNSNNTILVLLPSIMGILILVGLIFMKYTNFRGRPMTCGIDLGTTNSVICIQEQSTGLFTSSSSSSSSTTPNPTKKKTKKENLIIRCIADPRTGSPVVPSVVSFLDEKERQMILSSSSSSSDNTTTTTTTTKTNKKNRKLDYNINIQPDTNHVVVGYDAKRRIDTHPHHTIYHTKRVLGRNSSDPAIQTLRNEVEFIIRNQTTATTSSNNDDGDDDRGVEFHVPDTSLPITPQMVGTYIIHYLIQMTYQVLGHTSIKSAIICVPAKFNQKQRMVTKQIFINAGITVTRILEEPTAAALAYGLHHKSHIDYIVVYDFGGGTLDISLLHVSDGYVDVIGSDGDDNLGGTDFDHSIAHYLLYEKQLIVTSNDSNATGISLIQTIHSILQQIQQQESLHDRQDGVEVDIEDILLQRCPKLRMIPLCTISSLHTISEQLKISLSDGYRSDDEIVSVSAQCMYISDLQRQWTIDSFCSALVPYTFTLDSNEFNTIVQPLLDRSIVPLDRLLNDLNINAIRDIQEIVMVGGTTRMPQIRSLIQSYFPNSQMNIDIDPDLTVAYGAASVID